MPVRISNPAKKFKNGHDPPQGPNEDFFPAFFTTGLFYFLYF